MVASLCGFGHKSPKRILPSTDHPQELKSDEENVHRRPDTLTESIINFIKTRNHHHHQKKKVATLEEWILASPGPNDLKDCRQSLSSSSSHKKVYPSSSSSLSRGRLTVEGVVISGADRVEEAEDYYHSAATSFTSGLQSGKMKKKVSFRLPEVADIFILDDPRPTTSAHS
nr:hypothetical protein BC332_19914 [Ipomoea batatas]